METCSIELCWFVIADIFFEDPCEVSRFKVDAEDDAIDFVEKDISVAVDAIDKVRCRMIDEIGELQLAISLKRHT